jgi:hypothetical protein
MTIKIKAELLLIGDEILLGRYLYQTANGWVPALCFQSVNIILLIFVNCGAMLEQQRGIYYVEWVQVF